MLSVHNGLLFRQLCKELVHRIEFGGRARLMIDLHLLGVLAIVEIIEQAVSRTDLGCLIAELAGRQRNHRLLGGNSSNVL